MEDKENEPRRLTARTSDELWNKRKGEVSLFRLPDVEQSLEIFEVPGPLWRCIAPLRLSSNIQINPFPDSLDRLVDGWPKPNEQLERISCKMNVEMPAIMSRVSQDPQLVLRSHQRQFAIMKEMLAAPTMIAFEPPGVTPDIVSVGAQSTFVFDCVPLAAPHQNLWVRYMNVLCALLAGDEAPSGSTLVDLCLESGAAPLGLFRWIRAAGNWVRCMKDLWSPVAFILIFDLVSFLLVKYLHEGTLCQIREAVKLFLTDRGMENGGDIADQFISKIYQGSRFLEIFTNDFYTVKTFDANSYGESESWNVINTVRVSTEKTAPGTSQLVAEGDFFTETLLHDLSVKESFENLNTSREPLVSNTLLTICPSKLQWIFLSATVEGLLLRSEESGSVKEISVPLVIDLDPLRTRYETFINDSVPQSYVTSLGPSYHMPFLRARGLGEIQLDPKSSGLVFEPQLLTAVAPRVPMRKSTAIILLPEAALPHDIRSRVALLSCISGKWYSDDLDAILAASRPMGLRSPLPSPATVLDQVFRCHGDRYTAHHSEDALLL